MADLSYICPECVLLPKRNESSPDRYSDGKVPFGKAWKEKLTVNDVSFNDRKRSRYF